MTPELNCEARVVESGLCPDTPKAPAMVPTPLYAAPAAAATRLRVVLVAPRRMPAWLLRFFDLAADNPWLELVVLPVDGQDAPTAVPLPADLRALLRYENRRTTDVAMVAVTVCGHPDVAFGIALPSDLEPAALRAQVGLLAPDLVLLLGAPGWAEALGDRARWGCWELDSSLTDAGRAAQALLAPVMRGDVATAVELQLHHLDRPPTTLVTSWGSTCRASASIQRQRVSLKLPALLMRSLRRLANGELQVPPQRTARLQLASETPRRFGAGLRALASTLGFRLATRWRNRSQPGEEAWQIVIRHGAKRLDPDAPDVPRHTFLTAPAGHRWADPSVVDDGGRRLLFVEQWADRSEKAEIVCLDLLPDGRVRPLGVVLDQPFHVSYPQAFQWQGQWYLTVESGHAHCVSLYQAEDFPLRWQHCTDLVVGRACVDPTLHYHDNHWYLFADIAESGGSSCDELFLFVADQPTGPFRPHPANPIVSDARHARPAGRLFQREGRLIRPAQDCAPSYGAAVVFNEVLELTPTHYRERQLGRLDLRWELGMDGCHTYNQVDGIEVLDARGTPPSDSVQLAVLAFLPAVAAVDTGLSAGPGPGPEWSGSAQWAAEPSGSAGNVNRAQCGPDLIKT